MQEELKPNSKDLSHSSVNSFSLIQGVLDAGGVIEGDEVIVRENGVIHRIDGPAVVDFEGNQWWYFEGERHREGGPAVIMQNGGRIWFEHGFFIKSEKE